MVAVVHPEASTALWVLRYPIVLGSAATSCRYHPCKQVVPVPPSGYYTVSQGILLLRSSEKLDHYKSMLMSWRLHGKIKNW